MGKEYDTGLDAHKETLPIAYALGGGRGDATYQGTCTATAAGRCQNHCHIT